MIILHLLHTRLYVMSMVVHVVEYNPCLSNPCQNEGVCSNSTEGFVCTCSGNYEGTTCSGRYYPVLVSVRYVFQRRKDGRAHVPVIARLREYMHLHIQIQTTMSAACGKLLLST